MKLDVRLKRAYLCGGVERSLDAANLPLPRLRKSR
jgi:hypothetical protein